MKNKTFLSIAIFTATLFVIPQITFASWWNPGTWKIFNRKSEVKIERAIIATSTPDNRIVHMEKATTTEKIEQKNEESKNKKGTAGFVDTNTQKNDQSKEIEKLKKEVEKQSNANTKEQIAIKMATDIEYGGSFLDKNVRQEIKSNWGSIMEYYSGKRGKDTIENMYNDIMDAYYKWKNWQQYELESAKCTAELNERYEKALQKHKDIARKITSGQFLNDSSGTSSSDAFGETNSLKPESCYKADSLSGIEPDLYSQPIHQQTQYPLETDYDRYIKQSQDKKFKRETCERLGGLNIGDSCVY